MLKDGSSSLGLLWTGKTHFITVRIKLLVYYFRKAKLPSYNQINSI